MLNKLWFGLVIVCFALSFINLLAVAENDPTFGRESLMVLLMSNSCNIYEMLDEG